MGGEAPRLQENSALAKKLPATLQICRQLSGASGSPSRGCWARRVIQEPADPEPSPHLVSVTWRANNISSLCLSCSGNASCQLLSRAIRTTPQAEHWPEMSRSLFGPIWRTSIERGVGSTVNCLGPWRCGNFRLNNRENTIHTFLYAGCTQPEDAMLLDRGSPRSTD